MNTRFIKLSTIVSVLININLNLIFASVEPAQTKPLLLDQKQQSITPRMQQALNNLQEIRKMKEKKDEKSSAKRMLKLSANIAANTLYNFPTFPFSNTYSICKSTFNDKANLMIDEPKTKTDHILNTFSKSIATLIMGAWGFLGSTIATPFASPYLAFKKEQNVLKAIDELIIVLPYALSLHPDFKDRKADLLGINTIEDEEKLKASALEIIVKRNNVSESEINSYSFSSRVKKYLNGLAENAMKID